MFKASGLPDLLKGEIMCYNLRPSHPRNLRWASPLCKAFTATRSVHFYILLLRLQAANPMPIISTSTRLVPSAALELHVLIALYATVRQAAIAALSPPTASRIATPTC
eukprot:4975845-Pleurochrysis_carterae.AAC.1